MDLEFGAKPERRRREDRGAEGAETETPKALSGEGKRPPHYLPLNAFGISVSAPLAPRSSRLRRSGLAPKL